METKIMIFCKMTPLVSIAQKAINDLYFQGDLRVPFIMFKDVNATAEEIQGCCADKLVVIGEDVNGYAWEIYKEWAVFV